MNYKIKGAIEKNRTRITIGIILWFILAIVFVMPVGYSIHEATHNGKLAIDILFSKFIECVADPMLNIKNFPEYIPEFFGFLWKFSLVYIVVFIIGMVRTAPKNEYSDIENGSSDWSKHGEEYKILSKKEGMILAEDHYLPTDKKGNVNVLVVGRIWIW